MILINRIFDDILEKTREINNLKNIFWQVFERTDYTNGLINIIYVINSMKSKTMFEKEDINRFLSIPADKNKFSDEFFFTNSTSEHFLTTADFVNYFRKYLSVSSSTFDHANNPVPMQTRVHEILQKEQLLVNSIESKKISLQKSFKDDEKYFEFLVGLFNDLASYSPRSKRQTIDFQKFNCDLRAKHGFQLFSMSDLSLIQTHFHLNCDSGISLEEFLHLLIEYGPLQRYFQLKLHEQIKRVGNEPFLVINKNNPGLQTNLNNFVIEKQQSDKEPKGLKAIITQNMVNPRNETDAIISGKYQRNVHRNLYSGVENYPVMVDTIDPSNPNQKFEINQDFGRRSEQESRKLILKDIQMTQLTVDEAAQQKHLIDNLDEVQSQEFLPNKNNRPKRINADDSVEGNLSQLDSMIRENIMGHKY